MDHAWHDMPPISEFTTLIGPIQRRRGNDRWEYGLRVLARHGNELGILHGGVITAFLDEAIGNTCNELADRPHVTVQLNTNFLRKAEIGMFLECACDITRTTRSLTFVEARLHADGQAVATASAIFKAIGALTAQLRARRLQPAARRRVQERPDSGQDAGVIGIQPGAVVRRQQGGVDQAAVERGQGQRLEEQERLGGIRQVGFCTISRFSSRMPYSPGL